VNEYLCLNAAHRLGLTVAASRVLNFGSERCVVVSRYDRVVNTHGGLDRIHQEDLCQAMSVMPEQKYEADGGPGARSIAQLLRQQLGEESGELAVRQFFDALIVQWLLAAPDAHAKNYSLLHLGRSVRLAPIYDVSSALAYRDFYEPKIKLAMKIGGHYRVGAISRTSWAREAALAKLDAEMVVARARDLARQLPDAFADSTRAYRGDSSSTAFANILSARVIDRSNRCAALLGA
jgi:serine/threonine-protein kinase HipA